ncbi:hypothetical protein TNCV_2008741 [Trichonephila clavipes]|nr:hypothetical protein TNCV_2008741 [Trichonephila clavipes]
MFNALAAHGGNLNNRRAACPLVRLVEQEEEGKTCTTPRSFPLKTGMEPSKIVLSPVRCSKLQLTTCIQLASCHDEFRGPRSNVIVNQTS